MLALFRKEDPAKAARYCVSIMEPQIEEVKDRFETHADFEHALQVAACFIWGFLHSLSSKYVRKDHSRWKVALDVIGQICGTRMACLVAGEISREMRTPDGVLLFREGVRAARDQTKHGVPTVRLFLEGVGHLGDDDYSREWRDIARQFRKG